MALDARKLTKTDSGIGYYRLNLAKALLEEDEDLNILILLVYHTPRNLARLHNPRITEMIIPFPRDLSGACMRGATSYLTGHSFCSMLR